MRQVVNPFVPLCLRGEKKSTANPRISTSIPPSAMLLTTLLPIPCPQCQSRRGIAEFDESNDTYKLKCGACNSDVNLPPQNLSQEAA